MKNRPSTILWGAMGAAVLLALPAQSAVRVYGEASSTGPTITVQLFADIDTFPILSFTARVFYPAEQLTVQEAVLNDAVWYFHDGEHFVPYTPPDTSVPGEVLFVGGRMDAADPLAGVIGPRQLLGTVVFLRSAPETPEFQVTIGREGDYASFVTTAGTRLEALPGDVVFRSVTPDPNDQDLDGLGDRWERDFFKSPKLAYYLDDPDGDGLNNSGEQDAGTDPTDRLSTLRLTLRGEPGDWLLEWGSVRGHAYAVQQGDSPEALRTIEGGIKATPPMNEYPLKNLPGPEASYFRLLLDDSP